MIGPCAKQVVHAVIVATDGSTFEGTNFCMEAQKTCPRGDMPSGEGYELCWDVCRQPAHAEVNALQAAGQKARGATLYLMGHTHCCNACRHVCDLAGIKEVVIVEKLDG